MEDLVDRITEFLARPRQFSMLGEGEDFSLMGCSFRVTECEVHNPLSMETLHRIYIMPRSNRTGQVHFPISAVYSEIGLGREDMIMERVQICKKLAVKLVREVIPSISYRAKAELGNMENLAAIEALP